MHIHDFIPSPIPIHNPFHQFQKLNNIYLHQSDQVDLMSIFIYQPSVALLVPYDHSHQTQGWIKILLLEVSNRQISKLGPFCRGLRLQGKRLFYGTK